MRFIKALMGFLLFMAGSFIINMPSYQDDTQSILVMVKVIALILTMFGAYLFFNSFSKSKV